MEVKVDETVRRNVLLFAAVVGVGLLFLYFYQVITLGPKGKPTEA